MWANPTDSKPKHEPGEHCILSPSPPASLKKCIYRKVIYEENCNSLKDFNTSEVYSYHFTTRESAISYQGACSFSARFYLIIVPMNKTWIMKRKWKAVISIFSPSVWISLRVEKVENICSFHIKTSFVPTVSVLYRKSHRSWVRYFFTVLTNLAWSLLFTLFYHFFCSWYYQPPKTQKI